MSRRLNMAALALGLIVLAVGPLALTLARASDYRSSATIPLNPSNPSAPFLPNPEMLVATTLEVRDLQRDVAKEVGWFDAPDDLGEYVTVRERRRGDKVTFVTTARGPSPEEARELARVAAAAVRAAAETSARFTQPLQLQRIRQALRREGLSAPERAELLLRRRQIAASIEDEEPIFVESPEAPTLTQERIGDRILGALPGSRPLRPDPVWAAVAGVALALALALWVLVLSSAGGRRGTHFPS